MTKRIVYVQGTWDLFHVGHLNIIQRAFDISKELVIGVNTDESVRLHKGHLPIICYDDRVKVVESCKYVSKVIKSNGTIDTGILKQHGIDICILSTEWEMRELKGVEEAIKAGIEIRYLPYTERISTTIIRTRIREER